MKKIIEVMLSPRKLYKTQTEITTKDAPGFTSNNHTKSCRLLVSHIHKLGLQETHTFQKNLLKKSAIPTIIIGDSIATSLRRYQHTWMNYFKTSVCYFSLFLKGKYISSLFRMKYIKKKFNLQLFFIPIFLLKTCFEKITVCVIETMLMTQAFSQMKKSRREVNQKTKLKPK